MRNVLMVAAALLLISVPAAADYIGLYADPTASECSLTNLRLPPANNDVYVIHRFNTGATAAQFKVLDESGLFAAGVTTNFLVIGVLPTGASVAYGGCIVGDVVIATMHFLWFGQPISTPCLSRLTVVADPTASPNPLLVTVDCGFNLKQASGGYLTFGNPACCVIAPVASTTWGSVKALYR